MQNAYHMVTMATPHSCQRQNLGDYLDTTTRRGTQFVPWDLMEKNENYFRIGDVVNRMRDEEWRKRKSEYRLRVLRDGRGVEARFWKYRRSKRKRAGTRELKKKGGGLATSKNEIRWELEQHWRWLDHRASMRESEGDGRDGGWGGGGGGLGGLLGREEGRKRAGRVKGSLGDKGRELEGSFGSQRGVEETKKRRWEGTSWKLG